MVIRAGVPVFFGALLTVLGSQELLRGLAYTDAPSRLEEVRGSLLPVAIGVALMLTGMAIARRTRIGYLVGMAAALGFIVLAALFGFSLVPHLGDAGFNLAPGFLLFTIIAVVLAVAYGLVLRRGHATFAGTWGSSDRRFGILIAALLIASTLASTVLGAVASDVQVQAGVASEQAQSLVDGTTFDVRVVHATVGAANEVEGLTLDVRLRSTTGYVLATAPALCLTDLITATEVGKLGVLCWGADEPGFALPLVDLTVPPDGVTFEIDLDRGESICAYLAGPWSATLVLQPAISGQERLFRQAAFTVEGGVGPTVGAEQSPTPCGVSK
jgi:hypothetical protein